jgi:uncharacterized protein (DUF302 family)
VIKKILLVFLVLFLYPYSYAQTYNVSISETRSNYSFTETVELIKNSAEKRGWRIPAVHDLQKSLSTNGHEVLPVNIIEICNPEYAAIILRETGQRNLSAFMPCRISVFENEDGQVYISKMDINSIDSDEKMNKTLSSALLEMKEIVAEAIKRGN